MTTTLLTPQPMQVRIVGIATFGYGRRIRPEHVHGSHLAAAQRQLTDNPEHLTEIRVDAEPGVTPEDLAIRISAALPPSVQAITGTELAAENYSQLDSGFLGVVRNGLVAFAVIALLVAAFSIFNTFSILVTQRSREAALLRALGATRRQIITTSAVETLAVGLVGSAVGWVAGVGLAGLLKAVFDSFGFALPAGGLVFKPTSTAVALAAGIVATLVAGVLPSVRGSRIPPVAALRELAVEPPIVTGAARSLAPASRCSAPSPWAPPPSVRAAASSCLGPSRASSARWCSARWPPGLRSSRSAGRSRRCAASAATSRVRTRSDIRGALLPPPRH